MKLPDSGVNEAAVGSPVALHRDPSAMIRVTFNDLARLPVDRLAKLLMERAAEDPMLLSRLHATIAEEAPVTTRTTTPSGSGAQIVGASPAMRHVAEMIKRF